MTRLVWAPDAAGENGYRDAAPLFRRIAADLAAGCREIVVEVRGRHDLEEPLLFGETFTGPFDRVLFDGGGTAELRFGKRLSGGTGLCEAETESSFLYQGKRALYKARYPEKGYLRTAGVLRESPDRGFLFAPGDIPEGLDTAGLEIVLWPGGTTGAENWHTVTCPVESLDYAAGRVTLAQPSVLLTIGAGSRYYLQNAPRFLTKRGQFCASGGVAVYYPYAGGGAVTAAECRTPVSFLGTKRRPVHDVTLKGVRIFGADAPPLVQGEFGQYTGAVQLERAERVAVSGCEISLSAGHGVCLAGSCRDCRVENCFIHDVGHTGVYVAPVARPGGESCGHAVCNNHICRVGKLVGHGSGVQILRSDSITVAHNRIHHAPRYAVSVLGRVSMAFDEAGQPYLAGPDTQRRARHIEIAYNDVSHCNLDSQDTGVIQAYHAGPNVSVHHNLIHCSDIPFSFGTGVYLDDCCEGFRVHDNLLFRLQKKPSEGVLASAMTVKGRDHTVENNFVADCAVSADGGAFSLLHLGDDVSENAALQRNVVYRSGKCLYDFPNWTARRVAVAECNAAACGAFVRGAFSRAGRSELSGWTARGGFDQLTIRTDPRFMARGDLRLRYDSPAHALGIRDVDAGAIGLTEAFPFPASPPVRLYAKGLSGRSFLTLKPGERLSLNFFGRDGLGRPAACLPALSVEGDCVRAENGGLCGVRRGIARVTARAGRAALSLHVLVGDRDSGLKIVCAAGEADTGEEVAFLVAAETELGRSYAAEDAHVSVENGDLRRNAVCWYAAPNGRGPLKIRAERNGFTAEREVSLSCGRLAEARLTASSRILLPGERAELSAQCFNRAGEPVAAERAAFYCGGKRLPHGVLTAAGSGIVLAEARARRGKSAATAQMEIAVASGRDAPYPAVGIGGCAARCLEEAEALTLYGDGENAWYRADDFAFYGRAACGNFTLSGSFGPVARTHANAQCGLVLREGPTPGARSIQLRADAAGKVSAAVRRQTDGETACEAQMFAAFPVRLRLEARGSAVKAYVGTEDGDLLLWETEALFSGEVLAGLALFSVDTARLASCRVTGFSLGEET